MKTRDELIATARLQIEKATVLVEVVEEGVLSDAEAHRLLSIASCRTALADALLNLADTRERV